MRILSGHGNGSGSVSSNGNGILSPNGHLIELRSVVKIYPTNAGGVAALKGIDLAVSTGEFVAVLGKSGCGKSTLVNMITGIDRPTEGEVHVAGTALHDLGESKLARWRGLNVGVVFQFFQLLPSISVLDNVIMPMDFCGKYSRRERRERAMYLLDIVGLKEHVFKKPSEVSGGQQQRVAIARSLANDPPLVVADEPTGNLDSRTADHVLEIFQRLVDEGKTILMVTHDIDLARRMDRIIGMADGELVDEEAARETVSMGR
jgi:putative ABC transport system ATP-binding protein